MQDDFLVLVFADVGDVLAHHGKEKATITSLLETAESMEEVVLVKSMAQTKIPDGGALPERVADGLVIVHHIVWIAVCSNVESMP